MYILSEFYNYCANKNIYFNKTGVLPFNKTLFTFLQTEYIYTSEYFFPKAKRMLWWYFRKTFLRKKSNSVPLAEKQTTW